ncbi:PIN domain-containing protein [Phytohabitans sp. ZYX-F-186]|uniref:Ribonuclease VapC n=1 Tax=Phytohabitans maris TaxID=3071409 RepID=A0ABU0ZLH7_9ACTN|nr:PIN domain-containing protein [Phytohabitans sp. ZYX-F-186]MDQ7907902.1 PIN domain-containing protein [Phytohabitans sp. ZYX-F-186]
MKYLADTSALVRIERDKADTHWDKLVERGLVTICEPVLAETLLIADAKKYQSVEDKLRDHYPWATIPDNIWDLVAAIRRDLARRSAHKGMSVADYVVAATAIRLKLILLHEDGDFETIARFVPELRQQRISTLP